MDSSRVKKGFYFTAIAGEVMLGSFALIIQGVACFFQPLSVCANMMFQSVGENAKASLLASLRSGICYIPLIVILPYVIGLLGIQISQTIADVITFVVSAPLVFRFLKNLLENEIDREG